MQFEINVGDLGIAFAAISIAITIIGMSISWLMDARETKRNNAMDAIANRLIPFYGVILESLVRIDLFLTTSESVQYKDLRIDPEEFYAKASDAFVYITHAKTRQLIINIIQILEGLDLLDKDEKSDQIEMTLTQLLPLVATLKGLIELYLEQYSTIVKAKMPKLDKLSDTFQANLELSEEALKGMIAAINGENS